MKNETTELHNVRMDGAFVANKRILAMTKDERERMLIEEGDALRVRIRELKTQEANLLGQLRQAMEDVAKVRMQLEHVNNEIARLAQA